MPYRRNADLRKALRDVLPPAAQTIYRKAYNSAWEEYADASKRRGSATREEVSHRVAWAAVKHSYEKRGDRWVKKA